MMRDKLKSLPTDDLVDTFLSLTLAQEATFDRYETGKYNRLFGRILNVCLELKDRNELAALTSLLGHESLHVRLTAAIYTLGVAPAEARRVLEALAAAEDYPSTADARGILWSLDEGRFKPL